MPYIDVREVKARAQGRWESLLATIAPNLNEALAKPGRHVKCPVHGGTGDGFRLFKDVNDTGGGCCNTCGTFPDGFSLLTWATSASFKEILADVANLLGNAAAPVASKPRAAQVEVKDTAQEDAGIRMRLRSVYKSSRPIDADEAAPGRLYLANRGLSLVPSMLRVHPGLWNLDEDGQRYGPYPTLLSLVTDPEERGVTLHRIYLSEDGMKAPVPTPKKLMSHPSDVSLHGAAIRLFPPDKVLGVAEGVETAIAVTEATGIPCWPTISTAFMKTFVPPRGVQRLVVFGDKDRPTEQFPEGAGFQAARILVQTLWKKGFKASLQMPPSEIPDGAKSIDWLDEFVNNGKKPFARVLAA